MNFPLSAGRESPPRSPRPKRPPKQPDDMSGLAVLGNRPFLLLWLAQLSTQVGGNMVIYGLTIIITASYASSSAVSALLLSFLLPAIIFSAIVGFGFAGVITTMDLIGAKIMDEDTEKHHLRREGIIANALGFMGRLSGLFTSAAYLLVSKIYLFQSGDNPGPHPDAAARFLMTIVPPVLMVISFAFSWFINFNKKENAPAGPEAA